MSEIKKSKKTQLLLLGVFVGPLLLAIALFSLREWIPIAEPTANGTLIHPAQPIADIHVHLHDGTAINLDQFQEKWSYLTYFPASCSLDCEAALFKLRQVISASGRFSTRVQYVLVGQNQSVDQSDELVFSRHPKLSVGELKKLSTEAEAKKQLKAGHIYLVDPNGNMMMQYDRDATSKGMLKDIKKLLRLSNIG